MIELPFRIVSVANKREHWTKRAERSKAQRQGTAWMLERHATRPELPVIVTLTRVGMKKLDTDNLAIAFKACRDGVADWLGVDDGDERITWKYGQLGAKTYTAWVEFSGGRDEP